MATIKEEVLSRIQDSENEGLLKELLSILNFEEDINTEAYFSQDQIKRIEESQEQIKLGNFSTQNEVKEKVKKWLLK